MRAWVSLTAMALAAGTGLAFAQSSHTEHGHEMDYSTQPPGKVQAGADAELSEPGQGAFAALSEIVQVLEADPDTDWATVDLTGLRAHLVDMDRLISDAVVMETQLPDGIAAVATGDAKTIAALRRMVPAHASQLSRDDRWTVAASETAEGVELRVTSSDPAVIARIKGLGFFGLMASQDHHRAHHLTMALGKDPHDH